MMSEELFPVTSLDEGQEAVVCLLSGGENLAGRLGALLLELPDGQRFALGSGFTDADRTAPPAIGTVVTYRYRDRTLKGVPRFASFLRLRSPE